VIDVIYQEHQFAVVTDGRIDKVTPSEDTYKAIDLECDLQTNTEVMYFSAEGYLPYGEPWEKVGDHYFCNGKEEQ
jgi:spore germination cell wall hydrolase CwlJ-like protein